MFRTTRSAGVIGGTRRTARLPTLFAPLQEAEVVLDLGLFLQVEDVGEAGDEGAHVGAERAAMGPQVEDAVLHLLGPALGQLEQAVGLYLRLLDDALRLLAGRFLDLLGKALRGEEGVLEDRLALAVLVDQRAERLHLLLQAVTLALQRRHFLGHDVEVGAHLGGVEPAQPLGEGLPLEVHRRDFHSIGLPWLATRVARSRRRLKGFASGRRWGRRSKPGWARERPGSGNPGEAPPGRRGGRHTPDGASAGRGRPAPAPPRSGRRSRARRAPGTRCRAGSSGGCCAASGGSPAGEDRLAG